MPKSKSRIFEVKEILDSETDDSGKLFYKVSWKGFGAEEDSWEPEENLKNCHEMVRKYTRKSSSPKKVRGKSASPAKKSHKKSVSPAKKGRARSRSKSVAKSTPGGKRARSQSRGRSRTPSRGSKIPVPAKSTPAPTPKSAPQPKPRAPRGSTPKPETQVSLRSTRSSLKNNNVSSPLPSSGRSSPSKERYYRGSSRTRKLLGVPLTKRNSMILVVILSVILFGISFAFYKRTAFDGITSYFSKLKGGKA